MLNVIAHLHKSKKLYFPISLTFFFCFFTFSGIQAQPSHWLDMPLLSVEGDTLTLRETLGEKGAVLLFLDPDCPVSQKYGATIRQLSTQFMQRGIQTVAIYPLIRVDTAHLKAFAREYEYTFIHLLDPQMKLATAIGASVTPEAYLLSQSGKLMYHGAIDNWFYALGRYRKVVTEHYLRDAAEAYLYQKPISPKKTEAIGCMIGTGMMEKN